MATSTDIVNGALYYILAISILLLFGIAFFLVYFTVRYRKNRNPVPQELPGNWLIELAWVVGPTAIVLTMFLYGYTGFHFLRTAPADAITIKVHARQWSWLFEYDDGRKSADLIVPLGKNIRCKMTSADVIHGFYVPAFRIQQDIVPGITTEVWFKATTLGSNYVFCSQYCGLKHAAMTANLIVVPADQYAAWRQGKKISFTGDLYANMPAGQALLYQRGCISCHSPEGNKMVGPSFKGLYGSPVTVSTGGVERTITADSAYIYKSIVDPKADIVIGYPGTMPSGREVLSDEEIARIISYLKGLR